MAESLPSHAQKGSAAQLVADAASGGQARSTRPGFSSVYKNTAGDLRSLAHRQKLRKLDQTEAEYLSPLHYEEQAAGGNRLAESAQLSSSVHQSVEPKVSQKKTSLIRNRNYNLLWIGQMLSLTGDSFFSATLAIWIIDRLARGASWLPLAAGALAIAVVLPSLVVSPLAGVWLDRWNPRWTMIWVDGIQTALVALFLLMTLLVSNNSLLLIGCFATILLVSSGQQFFLPARVVVVADLVPEEHRVQAYGSLQQANYLAQIVGPVLAAPLYFALGPAWAILLNVLSFVISLLFLLLIPMQHVQEAGESQQVGFWQELREGLQFFVTNKVLVTLLISGMIFMLGAQVNNSFEFLYGVQNLHVPQALLGLYVACFGIGVVGGLPIITALAKRWSEVEVLWICLIMYGLTLLVLSRMTTAIPGMICVLVMGMTQGSVFVAVRPLTVLVTPRNLMGRVMSVEMPMITIASLVGGAVASVLASTALANLHAQLSGMTFGPLDTLLAAAGLLTIGGGIYARLTLYRAVKELRAKREVPG